MSQELVEWRWRWGLVGGWRKHWQVEQGLIACQGLQECHDLRVLPGRELLAQLQTPHDVHRLTQCGGFAIVEIGIG